MGVDRLEVQIGRTVRALRVEHSLTLDDVASAMRARGFDWSTGSVGNLEAGRMKLTLPLAVTLADALAARIGRDVTLADLLGDGDFVEISPRIRIRLSRIAAFLQGEPVAITASDMHPSPELSAAIDGLWERVSKHLESPAMEVPLAATRAAKRLGITVAELQLRALDAFGRTITEERDARAGADPSQQALGAAMRSVLRDLREG